MLNPRIKEIMTQAGYAAPEIAPRAQLLAHLIVQAISQHIAGSAKDSTNQDTHSWNEAVDYLGEEIRTYWRIKS